MFKKELYLNLNTKKILYFHRTTTPFLPTVHHFSKSIAVAFYLLPDMKPGAHKSDRTSILRRYVPLIISGKAKSGFLAYLLLHLGSGTAFAFVGKWMADRFELPIGQIGTVMMFLGFGSLLGSMISSYATRKQGRARTVAVGMSMLVVLYAVMPQLTNLTIVTIIYLIISVTLGVIFPMVMEALTSLDSSIRGTISSLANSTMNSANTLGAWLAGVLYVQMDGYSSIGIFSAACLALSLGTFQLGGVFTRKAVRAVDQESVSSSRN